MTTAATTLTQENLIKMEKGKKYLHQKTPSNPRSKTSKSREVADMSSDVFSWST